MNYTKHKWTNAEIEFLRSHYHSMNARDIADSLDSKHSVSSIYCKANGLGLNRDFSMKTKSKPEKKKKKRNLEKKKKRRDPEKKTRREPENKKKQWKPANYGPYDPLCHCCECIHYEPGTFKCRCWRVKGNNGDYLYVRPKDPSCRYFIPLTASSSSGERY